MASTKRRRDKEEFARRGDETFETQVRPQLKTEDEGKYAAIDIDSGAYELAEDELEACDRLNARVRDAQIWLVRVGSRYVHRFGGREMREKETRSEEFAQSAESERLTTSPLAEYPE